MSQVELGAPDAIQETTTQVQQKKGLRAVLAAAAVLILKLLKPLIVAFKFLQSGVFLKTGLTMILSLWVYAMAWGWPFAAAFIALLLVHEMGHSVMLKKMGVKSSVPIFIPFAGAFIDLKEMPEHVVPEAKMAIAGPLFGTAGAVVCWGIALYTGKPFWMAVAYTGFFLNLFNLIPISPLDGGRVVAAISQKIWALGSSAWW